MANVTFANPGDVIGSVAITVSETEIILDGGKGLAEIRCDADWEYASVSSGTKWPVPADQSILLRGRTFYATSTAGGDLLFLQTSGA